jgi:hypothetical protein
VPLDAVSEARISLHHIPGERGVSLRRPERIIRLPVSSPFITVRTVIAVAVRFAPYEQRDICPSQIMHVLSVVYVHKSDLHSPTCFVCPRWRAAKLEPRGSYTFISQQRVKDTYFVELTILAEPCSVGPTNSFRAFTGKSIG